MVQGGEVSVHYDPMIAKLIVAAEDRPAALKKMLAALRQYHIVGLPTNIDFVQACCAHPAFEKGGVDTGFIDENVDRLLPPTSDARPETVALAALSCTMKSTSSTSEDQDPWNTLKHFRSASDLESKVMLTDDEGKEREITFTHASTGRILANVDGEHDIVVSRVEMNEDDVIKAELDGHVVTASTVFDKSDRSVHLFYSGPPDKNSKSPDQCYFQFGVPADAYVQCLLSHLNTYFHTQTLSLTPKHTTHRYGIEGGAGSGGSSIRAPMPGKVVKLLVESGTQVAIGEPVMVLEAMKMEHVLEAPCDGTIDEIFAAVGDFVDDSSDLVRFSDEE